MRNIEFKSRWCWATVLWIAILITATSCASISSEIGQLCPFGLKIVSESNDPHATKILFIGNSFTYTNNVPAILAWMLNKQQPNHHFRIESFTLPSYSLQQHMQRNEIKNLLSNRAWDFVILQEQSGAAFEGQSAVRSSFGAFLSLVQTTGAKPLMVMTWADRGEFANEGIISQTYRRTGRDLNLTILPVGDLFFYVQEKYPQIALYLDDCHHPDVAGAYLYALTVYSQLFGDKNLPNIDNKDNSPPAPSIKPDVSRELSSSIKEWHSISKIYPEYTEESPDGNTDLAHYWAMNGRPLEAEALCQKRLGVVNRLFPLQNNSATASALRQLADAQYMFNTPEKIAQAYENYSRAEQIYKKIEGPASKNATNIASFMQQIKQYIKP